MEKVNLSCVAQLNERTGLNLQAVTYDGNNIADPLYALIDADQFPVDEEHTAEDYQLLTPFMTEVTLAPAVLGFLMLPPIIYPMLKERNSNIPE